MGAPLCLQLLHWASAPGEVAASFLLPSLRSLHISLPSMASAPAAPRVEAAKGLCPHFAEKEPEAQDNRSCQGHRACGRQREDLNESLPKSTAPETMPSRMDLAGPAWGSPLLHGDPLCLNRQQILVPDTITVNARVLKCFSYLQSFPFAALPPNPLSLSSWWTNWEMAGSYSSHPLSRWGH